LITAGMRVLIPRAVVARDVLPEELGRLGAVVNVVPAYRTVSGDADANGLGAKLAAGAIDLVTFTSSSTVTNLLGLLGPIGPALLANSKVACIGPVTAATCLEHGVNPDVIAEEYTIAGLVQAIRNFYEEGSR
jgi:uroporphyrinogen III methyltransferase/synthase